MDEEDFQIGHYCKFCRKKLDDLETDYHDSCRRLYDDYAEKQVKWQSLGLVEAEYELLIDLNNFFQTSDDFYWSRENKPVPDYSVWVSIENLIERRKYRHLETLEEYSGTKEPLFSVVTKDYKIVELTIRHVKISCLPQSFWDLESIKSLQFYDCEVEEFPTQEPKFTLLEKVVIVNSSLRTLTDRVVAFTSLYHLLLDCKKLESSLDVLSPLTQLRVVQLHNRGPQVDRFPLVLNKFPHMWFLGLTKWKLTEFPSELLTMTHLSTVDLSFNSIPSVPDQIKDLRDLFILRLKKNPVEGIPPWFEFRLRYQEYMRLVELQEFIWKNLHPNLSPREKKTTFFQVTPNKVDTPLFTPRLNNSEQFKFGFPDNYFKIKNGWVVELGISYVNTTNFNSCLVSFPYLRTLIIGDSNIEFFDLDPSRLQKLTTLNLIRSNISKLSERVGLLPIITNLLLKCVNLPHFPEFLSNLNELRTLILYQPPKEFNEDSFNFVCFLANLRYFSINDFSIVSIPDVVFTLKHLETLRVENCNLREVPAQLLELSCLNELVINPRPLNTDQSLLDELKSRGVAISMK